ncbi:GntR family transcriptional regulator [bacterium]|nr:MAG: GntR family transcriptional regulator [bacterium]
MNAAIRRIEPLPLDRASSLSVRTLTHLRDLIIAGRILPMTWLRMADIAGGLGTSITPVRSALLALEREGLVEIAKARGVRVIPMTRADIRDAYLMHEFLCGEMAARAALTIDEPLLQACRALQRRMERALTQRSSETIDGLNWEFHRVINGCAHSPRLARMLRQVTRSVPHAFHRLVPGWSRKAMPHHRALIEALASGSAEAARTTAQLHVRVGCELLLVRLERSGYWKKGTHSPLSSSS